MLEFCSFHSGEAEFPNIQFKNSTLPMGEYPCCGEMALRFQPLFQGAEGCKYRDHKVKVKNPKDSEMYLTLMTHRDLICISPKRKQSSLKILTDSSSVSLPTTKTGTHPAVNPAVQTGERLVQSQPCTTEKLSVDLASLMRSWEDADVEDTPAGKAKVREAGMDILWTGKPPQSSSSVEGSDDLPQSSKWEELSLVPERNVAGLVTRRWDRRLVKKPKMMAKKSIIQEASGMNDKKPQPGLNYGRIRRAPRLPQKKEKSTDTSSSSSDNGEDSSCGEEENGDHDELMGAEEDEEEDKKEVCIQVKLGKEEKVKPSLDKLTDSNWCAWDSIRATRPNQDYQRETEDTSMNDIQTHLAGRRSGKLVKMVNTETGIYRTGGSFLRLEQDWRDSHLAYLQHKTALVRSSRPSSAGSLVSRSRIRTPTIR